MSDETGSYDAAFYAAGAFIIAAGGVLLVMMCTKRLRKWQRNRRCGSDIVISANNRTKRVQIKEPSFVVVEVESVL